MRFADLIEPPFNFHDAAGKVQGHDVDIARHVFRAFGEVFEPIETEFAQRLPGLSIGDWRMTTGLCATGERRLDVLPTRPVWAFR
ncbi:MAG: transporter substrate-binding domain-containing protein [Pseudomonadota bacterium]